MGVLLFVNLNEVPGNCFICVRTNKLVRLTTFLDEGVIYRTVLFNFTKIEGWLKCLKIKKELI